jgi:hypothetical protein
MAVTPLHSPQVMHPVPCVGRGRLTQLGPAMQEGKESAEIAARVAALGDDPRLQVPAGETALQAVS